MNIELNDNILVQCPEINFNLRKASKCLLCTHYIGLEKATVGGIDVDANQADDFQVICGRPITRKLTKIYEG